MDMIDLAVFDMAGTTVADKDYVAKAFLKAFANQDIIVTEAEVNPLMGYHKPTAIQMVLERKGVEADAELIQTIHADFTGEMMDFYAYSPYVKAMPDTEDIFFYLKERGVRIALNTGFSKEIADVIVGRFQWRERGLIDDYIGSNEVPEGRPAPYMIEELKSRMNVSTDAVVMKVGDTVVDILEGQNAGCRYVIAVTTGAASKEELIGFNPTHVIDSLSQIPGILNQTVQYV